jgi:hypothetical protein
MFHPSESSLKVPFIRKLMLHVSPSFSLAQDNDSGSGHIFDS